jgi:TolB protein
MDWSPDGQKIAFTTWGDRRGPSGTNPSDIYITNADGSGRQRLTSDPGFETGPAWSPDGRKIAFVSGHGNYPGLFAMNADGSGQQRLTRGGSQPHWSPDGRQIAFVSKRYGYADIYVMNADGSGQRNLTRTPGHGRRESQPVWSPAQK